MLAGNQSAVRVFFFLRTIATDGNNKNNNNSQKKYWLLLFPEGAGESNANGGKGGYRLYYNYNLNII